MSNMRCSLCEDSNSDSLIHTIEYLNDKGEKQSMPVCEGCTGVCSHCETVMPLVGAFNCMKCENPVCAHCCFLVVPKTELAVNPLAPRCCIGCVDNVADSRYQSLRAPKSKKSK